MWRVREGCHLIMEVGKYWFLITRLLQGRVLPLEFGVVVNIKWAANFSLCQVWYHGSLHRILFPRRFLSYYFIFKIPKGEKTGHHRNRDWTWAWRESVSDIDRQEIWASLEPEWVLERPRYFYIFISLFGYSACFSHVIIKVAPEGIVVKQKLSVSREAKTEVLLSYQCLGF